MHSSEFVTIRLELRLAAYAAGASLKSALDGLPKLIGTTAAVLMLQGAPADIQRRGQDLIQRLKKTDPMLHDPAVSHAVHGIETYLTIMGAIGDALEPGELRSFAE